MTRRRVVPVFLFVAAVFAPLLVSADSDLRPSGESYFRQYEEITGAVVGDALRQFQTRARDKYVFGADASLDFSEWLKLRGAVGFDRVVTQRLLSGGVDYVDGLSFVRDVEVRYESPLGERAGNFGVGALGSLRESADDVVVWELRGFVGEDDVAGANVGAAYRRLVSDDFLAGVNAFLDYERGGDDVADESFWRWSAGVEATGRHLDFSANRYWAISDAVMSTLNGEVFRVYSADGWDAELRGRVAVRYPVAFRFLDSAEVAARYYVWEGDGDGTGGGDADVSGARYRFGFVPLPQLRFGVEYDSGDGGGKHFGYYVNFRHRLGSSAESVLRDDGDDVWQRRFDPVRREHQQHIMRTQAGAGVVTSVEIYLSSVTANSEVLTLSSYFPAGANYSYAVVSANPPGWTNSVSVDTNTGVVTDSGAKNAASGGTVYFSVVGGGVNLEFTVFFRDLSVGVAGADDDGQVRLFLSSLTANAVLLTVMAGGGASRTIAVASAVPAAWENLLSINQVNGEVTDNGLVADGRNGVVVFSVTDDDGAMVLLTVRFGDLLFDDVAVTLTSDDEGSAVVTLIASGGAGGYSYALVSTNPAGAAVSLMVVGEELIDNGLAAGGAAVVSAFVSATDGDGFVVSAAVAVEVLDDVGVTEDDFSLTLTPGDVSVTLLTITASGGDGAYAYELVSTNPVSFLDSVTVNSSGEVIDSGAASAGATVLTAFFSATDSSGAMIVLVTVMIEVLNAFVLADDDFELTLVSSDAGAALQTLSASGGASPYMFAVASADPSGWNNSLAINADGIITDSGAAADRAEQATVFFSVTDDIGSVLTATVSLQTFADLVLADDDISLTLNAGDAGTAIQTLMASGGDGDYGYRLISGNGVAINSSGVITDNGIASAGAASVTAIFEVTDDFAFTVSATVDIVVFGALAFADDDISLTLVSGDAGMAVQTLTATGGDGSYTYAVASANPSAWSASLSIDGNSGIITDSGAASAGAATASVVFSATDGDSNVVLATVEVVVVDDLVVGAVNFTVSLNSGSVGDAVLTLTASGGLAPLSYAVVSANPSVWMSGGLLAVNNGIITHNNVATATGDGTVVFAVTDSNGMVVNAAVNFHYTAVKFTQRSNHSSAVFNGRMYVIGGYDGTNNLSDVWSSPDGVNWVQETAAAGFVARNGHQSAVLGGTLYVVGGGNGTNVYHDDVWATEDGANWTVQVSAAFPARIDPELRVLKGTMYVIAGLGVGFAARNDIWSSDDGSTWTEETSAPGFVARFGPSAAVLNDALYVIGGRNASFTYTNDVWSSTDGAAFSQVTPSGSVFSTRSLHSSAVFNNEMYVIGGGGGSGVIRDVWSSADGAAWTQKATPGFSGRNGHSTVVFNNRLWVLGGNSNTRLNDVWSSADGTTWTQH